MLYSWVERRPAAPAAMAAAQHERDRGNDPIDAGSSNDTGSASLQTIRHLIGSACLPVERRHGEASGLITTSWGELSERLTSESPGSANRSTRGSEFHARRIDRPIGGTTRLLGSPNHPGNIPAHDDSDWCPCGRNSTGKGNIRC
jgi:hypothetical protein